MSHTQCRRRVLVEGLGKHELASADRIVESLRRAGWPQPTRSLVLQVATEHLIDRLRGQSREEIVRLFVERGLVGRTGPAPQVY